MMFFLSKYKIIILLAFSFVILFSSVLIYRNFQVAQITSFEECSDAGFPIREIYPAQCVTPDGRVFTQEVKEELRTIIGEIVCLPKKNSGEVTTLECALGLKDSNGDFYSLSDPDFEFIGNLPVGEEVTVEGIFSTDDENIYKIIGKLEVKSVTKNN